MPVKNKLVPIAWLIIASTIALIVLGALGLTSWWLVPYPTFIYLSFIAIYMLHGTKLVNFALKAHFNKQK
jgi:hypothetical protein